MATVREVLTRHGLLDTEILEINYHVNILECDIDFLKEKLTFLRGRTNVEIAMFAVELLKKCDITKMDYSEKLEQDLTDLYNEYKNAQTISKR